MTDEQLVTLKEAAMPLMQWLNDNCHPHCTAVVDSEHVELLEGLATARREAAAHKKSLSVHGLAGAVWPTGTRISTLNKDGKWEEVQG